MDLQQRLKGALFSHLIANSAIPLIGSGVGGLLVGAAQLASGHQPVVIAWLLLLYASIGVRVLLVRRCRRRMAVEGYDPAEAIRYAATTSLSGIVWGLAGLMIPGAAPLAMVVTITAIQAMVMGAVMTLGAFIPSFLAFSIPAMLPMILVFLWMGGAVNLVLALYSAIFFLLMVGVARRFNGSLSETWRLTFEKADLVSALTLAHDSLAVLAQTDGLTGIPNRRRFDEVLAADYGRLHRSGAPLSLLILDVDHFKAYNDSYGHVAGDACLKIVAEVMRRQLNRATDLAARYGGEEFAGILPETDHEGALALAEKIRTEVMVQSALHCPSENQNQVTVSIGLVTVDCSSIASAEEVVAMADRQLYRAKAEGRNRVVAWCHGADQGSSRAAS